MLKHDVASARIEDVASGQVFADRPYAWGIAGVTASGRRFAGFELENPKRGGKGKRAVVEGALAGVFAVRQTFERVGDDLVETIEIRNTTAETALVEWLGIGFRADLAGRDAWRLAAIPFLVQQDGYRHDYTGWRLQERDFHNSVYSERSRPEPALTEQGVLRSEAWAWGTGDTGLVVMKYNNEAIEFSVAGVDPQVAGAWLRFGGAGFCLYGEPSGARRLEPGQSFAFGETVYSAYSGGIEQAFYRYRRLLSDRGHARPADYNPPVNWNELYDVGWFHSDREKLRKNYTRKALLAEAAKARDVGCEMLYLDPGWGVSEGSTQWDESRLGPVGDLVETLRRDYGLSLGYRTILRSYAPTGASDGWPDEFLVRHYPDAPGKTTSMVCLGAPVAFTEPCLCHEPYFREKLRRILAISKQGVRFMMFDEMDWRGPCHAAHHTHKSPTTALDHALAVMRLCREVRRECPDLVAETHDPIWPWHTCRYLPTYFRQGFGERGDFDENWGFEYMWDCLNDLKSGKALSLYYYALGCDIPLYLHITMAADNDACLFFWWAASTVRHLGIGGKEGHPSVTPKDLPTWDKEKRFAAYKQAMQTYRRLKSYFARGNFIGLGEHAHLHTLSGKRGGVLNLFNLADTETTTDLSISADLLGGRDLEVRGVDARWDRGVLRVTATLAPLSPALVAIGDAAPSA